MTYSIVFRIRRHYFTQIISGEKTVEYRAASTHWRKIVRRLLELGYIESEPILGDTPVTVQKELAGVFVNPPKNKYPGTRRLLVLKIGLHASSVEALGRAPSDQGRKDLGVGMIYSFHLGEVVP